MFCLFMWGFLLFGFLGFVVVVVGLGVFQSEKSKDLYFQVVLSFLMSCPCLVH